MSKLLALGVLVGFGVLCVGFLPLLTAAHVPQGEVGKVSKDARAHAMQSASCTPSASPSTSPERKTKF